MLSIPPGGRCCQPGNQFKGVEMHKVFQLFHTMRAAALLMLALAFAVQAQAATMVDIYGPGQNQINLAMASPLTAPHQPATALGPSCMKPSMPT